MNSYDSGFSVQDSSREREGRGERRPEMEPFLKRNVNSLSRGQITLFTPERRWGKFPHRYRTVALHGIRDPNLVDRSSEVMLTN